MYRRLRQLARGGMAEVHLARTLGIGGFQKLLVIKRILPELAGNPEFVDMFVDEARIAATLDHSNIVHVYDVGREDGDVFFAMEYLHGQDLRAILGKGAPPLSATVAILLGVCAGLHYAHEKADEGGRPLGIVHRDVSPHNVIVTYDGGVKIIDFGIAKAAGKINQTQNGLLRGKFGYMSPEQCRCEPLDRRSDVFNLGILLWELAVGRKLFEAPNEYELVKQIVGGPAPAPPGVPAELARIITKALSPAAGDRHPTARALQLDLEAFARAERLDVTPQALERTMQALFPDQRPEPVDDAGPVTRTASGELTPRSMPATRWPWLGLLALVAAGAIAVLSWPNRDPGHPERRHEVPESKDVLPPDAAPVIAAPDAAPPTPTKPRKKHQTRHNGEPVDPDAPLPH